MPSVNDDLAAGAAMLLEHPIAQAVPKSDLARKVQKAADASDILRAIKDLDQDALLTTYEAFVVNVNAVLETIDEHATRPSTIMPTGLAMQQIVNDHLEARLRILVDGFYHDALELPGCLRRIDAAFSDARYAFQNLIAKQRLLIEEMLKQEVQALLDVLRSRIMREEDPQNRMLLLETYGNAISRTRVVQQDLIQIETQARKDLTTCDTLRTQSREVSSLSQEISEKVRQIEHLVGIFGIPCPPEIGRQLQEVRQRLQLIHSQSQSQRLQSMLSFQGMIPALPRSVQSLFDDRASHSAFAMLYIVNPACLFKDSTTKQIAIERLCVLMALLIDEDKGLGRKSIVSMLSLSGLAREEDHGMFETTIEKMVGVMFDQIPFKRTTVLRPTQECRRAAEATLEAALDPEGLHLALIKGKRAYWDQKYAGRKPNDKTATGTDEL